MHPKDSAKDAIEGAREALIDLSHRIHANPELRFEEHKASGWLSEALSGAGFTVEKGVCDLPTAFVARAGSGALHCDLAEYDARGSARVRTQHHRRERARRRARAREERAAVSRTRADRRHARGRGRRRQDPAHRGGLTVCMPLMVHPAPIDVAAPPVNAALGFEVNYTGKEAHASSYPERGINAADALTIAQTAIGLLRQHIRTTDRVHGIVTKGGDAPNVVPADTSARYAVRARTLANLDEIKEKVYRCFEAGALATGRRWRSWSGRAPKRAAQRRGPGGDVQRNAEELGRILPDLGRGGAVRRIDGHGNVSLAMRRFTR
jgi:metal-dependent amidase/aminoacylase/carboxypeptidase family protein